MKYDVIVIGGGPGGYHAAIKASSSGLTTLLIEKAALGGVCLNEGCIPTKTLLYSAKLYDNAINGEKYGVYIESAKLDHKAVLRRKAKVIRVLGAGIRSALADAGVTCVSAQARLCGRADRPRCTAVMQGDDIRTPGASVHEKAAYVYKGAISTEEATSAEEAASVYGEVASAQDIDVLVGDAVYCGANIILATGSRPVLPGIPGVQEALASGFLLTSTEALSLDEAPRSLAVVGGGVIGLEMAYYYNNAGSKVTVLELLPEIGGVTDAGISAELASEMSRKGITILTQSAVARVGEGSVSYRDAQSGGILELSCDKVLMAVGRTPNIDDLGLNEVGVLYARGGVITDDFCRTNIPGVYAVGDINGKYMLAHTAYREAEACINHILGVDDPMDYNSIPMVLYTNPEAAFVGDTLESAQKKGCDCTELVLPLRHSGRYLAENESANGLCKAVVDRSSRRILGLHMVGNHSSEVIYGAGMMIQSGMCVDDVEKVVFPHPSVSEIIKAVLTGGLA